MIYGYARVSTKGQLRDGNSLDAQHESLTEAGCTEIVQEAFTGTTTDRPEFDALLDKLQDGDTLVVTKLDRIARTVTGGCEVVRSLLDRGVTVRVLNMGTLDNTPVGKMMVSVMFAMAEFERDMIAQRTAEGKAVAKQKPGWREGRPPAEVDLEEFKRHVALVKAKKEKRRDACAQLGIGVSTYTKIRRRLIDSGELDG